MNYEKIVTLYDTAEHAEAARQDSAELVFFRSSLSLLAPWWALYVC